MDLPIELQSGSFVAGYDELQQVVSLVIKSSPGQLLQNPNWGAGKVIHSSMKDEVTDVIKEEVEKINGCDVEKCEFISDNDIEMILRYRGEIKKFQFAV